MWNELTGWGATHTGRVRRYNEDSCQVGTWRPGPDNWSWHGTMHGSTRWAAIADGMGGHRGGEKASALVIEGLSQLMHAVSGENDVVRVLAEVNARLYAGMNAPGGSPGMGSTVVGVVMDGLHGWFFNVGDSRAYILVRGRLRRVSVDHTPHRSAAGSRSHALTQSLGGTLAPRPLSPHVARIDLSSVDGVLLCSDGLTDMVGEDEIETVLQTQSEDPATALVEAAIEAGGMDNVTVVVVRPLDRWGPTKRSSARSIGMA